MAASENANSCLQCLKKAMTSKMKRISSDQKSLQSYKTSSKQAAAKYVSMMFGSKHLNHAIPRPPNPPSSKKLTTSMLVECKQHAK